MKKQDIMLEDKITNKKKKLKRISIPIQPNMSRKSYIQGSGSKCCNNTEVHSWTRKVQLATFGGCTEGETKESPICVLHQELKKEQCNEVLNEINKIFLLFLFPFLGS